MIEKFLREERVNSLKESTIQTHRSVLKQADKYKSLSQWDKEILNQYISQVQKTSKPGTVETKKGILKSFFLWLGKPEIVVHIRVKMPKTALKREDILSVDDVNKLIDHTDSHMYKALISFLFESGARISEALAIKVKDVQETDRGMIISVLQTKTGNDHRRSLYLFSASYIRNHLTYSGLTKGDRLFPVKRVAVFTMLRKIESKAKTGKRVNPHSFRHGRATDLVLRGMNEQLIRKQLGWTGDSAMIARYTHMVDEDVIDALASMNGIGNETGSHKKPIGVIHPAEPLNLADTNLQLNHIFADNQALHELVDEEFRTNQELRDRIKYLEQLVFEELELHEQKSS